MADVVAAPAPAPAGTVRRAVVERGASVHVRKPIAHDRHLAWTRLPAAEPTTILGRDR